MDDSVWGKLSFVNDQGKEPILISRRRFVIGRGKDCDISLGSKSLSKHHCYLELCDDGQVHLCDTSSNGTLLNKTTKVTRGQSVALKTGDEFCIAFQKDVKGISLLFSNLKEAIKDERLLNDDTLEYSSFELEIESHEAATSKCETGGEMLTTVDEKKLDEKVVNEVTVAVEKPCPGGESDDEMLDYLICSICQEIIYKCVSLLPCMHCFCSACYSEWMIMSQECPQCRVKVKRLAPNYIVTGMVDTYLKHHPEKQRNADELKELDRKNRITKKMLYPQDTTRNELDDGFRRTLDEDGNDYSDDPDFSDDSDSSDDPDFRLYNGPAFVRNQIKRHRPPLPYLKTCRQCPDNPQAKRSKTGYEAEVKVEEAGSSTQSGTNAVVDQLSRYVCGPGTIHIPCRCCFKQMPDRSRDRLLDKTIPPQNCVLCVPGVMFCHLYWGCDRPGCTGCLSAFKDVVLADNCLDLAINGNQYESAVLMDYLRKKKLTWRDVLRACLPKLDAGEYGVTMRTLNYTPQSGTINSSSVICKECAYKCFSHLVYQYRKDIAKEQLPAEVTAREDCYWGYNCRTQIKYHHAKKFNHICKQTRFA